MSRVFCLLERADGGNTLTTLRLVDGREERTLTLAADAGPGQAAAWIAQQLGATARLGTAGSGNGTRQANGNGGAEGRMVTLCLDADGARCAWLTTPSADPGVLQAVVREHAFAGGEDAGERFGVWAPVHGEAGLDLAVQALTETLPAPTAAPRLQGRRPDATAERCRLAVLAVPDLPVRLLVDELDSVGIVVEECVSVWHAIASAWDPARAPALAAGVLAPAHTDASVLDGSEPVSATVVVDPRGRLLWAWSRDGRLLAAGTMRLRRAADGDVSVIEVSRSEVGRVVSDWLAWSVQLGVAPARIGVVGPDNVTCAGLANDLPDVPGVGAVARALGTHWPGTPVTAHVEADPLGITLARLASEVRSGPAAGADDSRADQSLTVLSRRPVRATRRMYAWSAAALFALAGVIGIGAWKIDAGIARIETLRAEQVAARAEALTRIRALVPNADTLREPVKAIRAKAGEIEKMRGAMTPERPVLAAFAQIAAAVDATPGVRFREKERLSITGIAGITARFSVPDAQTGPNLLIALRENLDPPRIDWQGNPGGTAESRTYNISGTWAEPKPGTAEARPR
ncbi:MAG: hypothetical protein ACKVS8_10460 [Phycisphaerales bacterium]